MKNGRRNRGRSKSARGAESKQFDKGLNLEPLLTDKSFVSDLERMAQLHYLNLGIEKIEDLEDIFNPLLSRSKKDYQEPEREILRWMSNPEYWWFTAKILFGITLQPIQNVILKTMYDYPYVMLIGSRGLGKTFLSALYKMMTLTFRQGTKGIIAGAGFRQSRMVFEYMEKFYNDSPILRDIIGKDERQGVSRQPDRWTMYLGQSESHAVPIGDGTKIRGFRSNLTLADEFQSQNPQIYEEVIQGFMAVAKDPSLKVVERAARQFLKDRNAWNEESEYNYAKKNRPNQSIISGTADYAFGHFCEYFERYKTIIESQGDPEKLKSLSKTAISEGFKWDNFAIIRIPVECTPSAYMDEDSIERSKMMMPRNLFINEYGACFSKDSNGFIPMSLIHYCTTNNAIERPSGPVRFSASLSGSVHKKYIFGVDPAQKQDNFAISILELCEDHRRLVYTWTTNNENYEEKVKNGLIKEHNYYAYCARKIRDLMKLFPTDLIVMDDLGGGRALAEALKDQDKLQKNEQPIYEIRADHPLGDGKEKDTDDLAGLHILEMVNFSSYEYVAAANIGLKKDLEDKILLFPYIDQVDLAIDFEENSKRIKEEDRAKRMYDTLEDCVMEIEELKQEMASIIETPTPNRQRTRWAAPEVQTSSQTKSTGHDDRYMSILIANAAARRLDRHINFSMELIGGGVISQGPADRKKNLAMYSNAPDWFQQAVSGYR